MNDNSLKTIHDVTFGAFTVEGCAKNTLKKSNKHGPLHKEQFTFERQ